MTAIIVEDMPQAVAVLQADLATYCPEVEVIGVAPSVVAAAKLLRAQQPDIIFLDILLGDGTGFDLLEIVPNLTSRIIFVTASEEFALRAFRYAAIDYLLKPIEPELLMEAVQRASTQLTGQRESINVLKEAIAQPDVLPTRLSLHTSNRIFVVEVAAIVRLEGEDNYTTFYMQNGNKILVSKTLKHYERLLDVHGFMRVHQSHLVNFQYVTSLDYYEGYTLVLQNGDKIPVARRKKGEVVSRFDQMNT